MGTFNAGSVEASLTLDRSPWNRELKEWEAQVKKMEETSITITIDADTDNFFIQSNNVELFADDLDQKSVSIMVDMDAEKFHQAAAQVELVTDAIGSSNPTVNVDMDSTAFHAGAAYVELTSDAIGSMDPTVNVDMDSSAFHAGAAQVELVSDIMASNDINVNVGTSGIPKTLAELAELEVAIDIVDANDINIGVNYDRNNMERLIGNGSSGFGGGGGGSMGLLQIAILAVISLSPILGAAIGVLGADIVAFGAAIIGALGPLALIIGAFVVLIKAFKKTDAAARTPAMKFLAGQLARLKAIIDRFTKSPAAQHFFMAMGLAVSILNKVLILALPLMQGLGNYVEDLANSIGAFVNSPEFQMWINWWGSDGLQFLKMFVNMIGSLIQFLVNLSIAMSPFAKRLMRGLMEDLKDLANWSEHLGQNKGFEDWLKRAQHYAPLLLELVGDIFKVLFHIGDAIRPFAEPMINALDAIADAIQRIPVGVLTQLIRAGVLLFAAWKTIGLIVTIVEGLTTAFEVLAAVLSAPLLPILLIIAAAAALAAIFIYLWKTNGKLKQMVMENWKQIKETVAPIVQDITDVIKEHWGDIVQWAKGNWHDLQGIFMSAFTIIHQIVFFAVTAIAWVWTHYGDIILESVVGWVTGVAHVIRGLVQILAGIMHLIADVLTGNWSHIGADFRKIGRGAVNVVIGLFEMFHSVISGIVRTLARTLGAIWGLMWDHLKSQVHDGWQNIKDAFGSFFGWLDGIGDHIDHAVSGMWDGITSGFKTAINAIIDFWNGLHFGIPGWDPPGPGPKFPGFTVNTPDIPRMAHGALVSEPTIAMVGEGGEPEIVSPESKMAEIVSKFSGGQIDYSKMSEALMRALQPLVGSVLTPELLDKILEKAGMKVDVHAENDDRSVSALMREFGFQMRVLGYEGAIPA